MKSRNNSSFVYLILIAAVLFLIYSYVSGGTQAPTVPLSQIAEDINSGRVASISVRGDELSVTYKERTASGDLVVLSRKGPESALVEQLQALGVDAEKLRQVDIDFEEPVDQYPRGCGLFLPVHPSVSGSKQPGFVIWQEPGKDVLGRSSYGDFR